MFEKVKGLSLQGCGFVEERNLDLLKYPFNVVYGRNGSGKSTIAKAFKQIAGVGDVDGEGALERAVLYGDEELLENEIVVDYPTFMKGKKFNKLILVTPPEKMCEIRKVAATFHSEQYVGIQTEPHLFEYFDSRINKGVGVKKTCEHFGIQLENVVAFGDSLNDKEMLQEVGLGIAMANANDEIKKVADCISEYTNEEDALANFIEDFIETKKPDKLDIDANLKWQK